MEREHEDLCKAIVPPCGVLRVLLGVECDLLHCITGCFSTARARASKQPKKEASNYLFQLMFNLLKNRRSKRNITCNSIYPQSGFFGLFFQLRSNRAAVLPVLEVSLVKRTDSIDSGSLSRLLLINIFQRMCGFIVCSWL